MSKKTKTAQVASDPRNNAQDAYKVFMAMSNSEWAGLWASVGDQGLGLQFQEQRGYIKALAERGSPGKKTVAPPHTQKVKGIRDNVAQPSAITKAPPMSGLALTFDKGMTMAKDHMGAAMQALTATICIKDLTPLQLSQCHDYTAYTLDAVEEAKKLARARVLDVALNTGSPVGDSGLSREVALPGGMVQRVTVQRSGTDPKKFESGLRAKGKDPREYMEQVITYKMTAGGPNKAIDDGIFTQDEIMAMAYEPQYRVERMKEAKSDE